MAIFNTVYGGEYHLPGAYKKVEYIESSGTQWINTGVIPTQDTLIKIRAMFLELSGNVVFGYYIGNDNTDWRFGSGFYAAGSRRWFHDIGGNRIEKAQQLSTDTIYEWEFGNYYVKDIQTGTTLVSGSTVTSFTGTSTITLNNCDNTSYSKNRWYYFKIYSGSTLQRDLVPCYRKSDNVIGMYDLVNKQFYTNAGSGTFIKGPDVN